MKVSGVIQSAKNNTKKGRRETKENGKNLAGNCREKKTERVAPPGARCCRIQGSGVLYLNSEYGFRGRLFSLQSYRSMKTRKTTWRFSCLRFKKK